MTNRDQLPSAPNGIFGSPGPRPSLARDDDRPFSEIRQSLGDVTRILSLHRWAFFIPFCLVSSAAFIMSLYYPRTYSASTTFERRSDPVLVDLPNPDSPGAASFEYFRSTMDKDLTSTRNMTEAIDHLGLTKDLPRNPDGTFTKAAEEKREAIARSFASTISVSTDSPSKHADIVYLTYTGSNPTIGAKLLDEVKEIYISHTRKWVRTFLEDQRSYFDAQLADAAEARRLAKRTETQLYLENPLINPQNPGAISARLDQLAAEHRSLMLRKREREAELGELQQLVVETDAQNNAGNLLVNASQPRDAATPQRYISPEAILLSSQIRDMEKEVFQMREVGGMTDEHPKVKALLESRKQLQNQLERQQARDRAITSNQSSEDRTALMASSFPVPIPMSPEQTRLELRIETMKSKIKEIELNLETNDLARKRHERAKENIFRKQDEFQAAAAEVAKTRKRYLEVARTLARFTPAIKAVSQNHLFQFREGDRARGSIVPVNPKAGTILLLAILAGLAAGTVFVILAEIIDHVYRSAAHVARSLGLPILDGIDEIITAADRRRRLIAHTVVAPIIVAGFLAITGLAGTVAYVSIQRPWFLDRIKNTPTKVWKAVTEAHDPVAPLASISR